MRRGQVVAQQPLIKKMSEDMCGAYLDVRSRVSSGQVCGIAGKALPNLTVGLVSARDDYIFLISSVSFC